MCHCKTIWAQDCQFMSPNCLPSNCLWFVQKAVKYFWDLKLISSVIFLWFYVNIIKDTFTSLICFKTNCFFSRVLILFLISGRSKVLFLVWGPFLFFLKLNILNRLARLQTQHSHNNGKGSKRFLTFSSHNFFFFNLSPIKYFFRLATIWVFNHCFH